MCRHGARLYNTSARCSGVVSLLSTYHGGGSFAHFRFFFLDQVLDEAAHGVQGGHGQHEAKQIAYGQVEQVLVVARRGKRHTRPRGGLALRRTCRPNAWAGREVERKLVDQLAHLLFIFQGRGEYIREGNVNRLKYVIEKRRRERVKL